MSSQTFAYQQPFQFLEIELKGEKRYFIEGFISTTDADLSNEVLTMKAQEDIVRQCLNNVITMDVEHEEFYKEGRVQAKPNNTRIPVAKIVEAEIRGNGVWVKAEVNRHSDRFKNIWGSIKEGFLHSFSVAFYPMSAVTKNVAGQVLKFIDSLSLVNVTLTGSPVNPNATFTPVMKAVLLNMPAQGEIMENKQVDAPVADIKAEPVAPVEAAPVAPEVKSSDFSADFAQMKSDFEALKKAFAEMQACKKSEDEKEEDEVKDENAVPAVEEKAQAVHGGQNPHVKADSELAATVKSLQDEVASLKAEMAKPVVKGIGPETNVAKFATQTQVKPVNSVLDFIR